MNMKFGTLLVCWLLLMISSCKKDSGNNDNEQLDASTQQFNDDSNRYKSESDQADADINEQLRGMNGFGTAAPAASLPCGVSIDVSQLSQKIVTFTFDGVTRCFIPQRIRAGKIKVQLTSGNLWQDVDAVLTITYDSFKVTRVSDNRSIMFNGVKTLRNINGNDWVAFLSSNFTLKYQERAKDMQVTFDNNLHATWNSARITEWTYTNNGIPQFNFTCNGDTTINGVSYVDSYGTNRFNHDFVTYYISPLHSNTHCGLWMPTSGQLVHWIGRNFILFLGVDQNGNPVLSGCAYGFKVTWTANNGSQSAVFPYY